MNMPVSTVSFDSKFDFLCEYEGTFLSQADMYFLCVYTQVYVCLGLELFGRATVPGPKHL